MLVEAESFGIVRMELERLLPRLVEDTRRAVGLLRVKHLEDETKFNGGETSSVPVEVVPVVQASRTFTWQLADGVSSLAEVGQVFKQRLLRQAVDRGQCDDLVVVLSELAANAIAAPSPSGTIAVRSWRAEDEVALEVENPPQDSNVGFAVPADRDPLRGSGRGLLIVPAYTDTVEVIPPDLTKGLTVRCRKQVMSEPGRDVVAGTR